ncbi:MAG: phage tail protein, partial [Steroidobacteraceae bacterium]
NTGDLATAAGLTRGQQRILRRLMTNPVDAVNGIPPDYIWEPNYGAGLPRFIGKPFDRQKITAVILANILLEDSVAQSPPPLVTLRQLSADPTGFWVGITYTDDETGVPMTLSFTVTS